MASIREPSKNFGHRCFSLARKAVDMANNILLFQYSVLQKQVFIAFKILFLDSPKSVFCFLISREQKNFSDLAILNAHHINTIHRNLTFLVLG